MDIRLRPYQLSDQLALATLANNAKVSANLKDIFPYPYTINDAANYLNFITQAKSNLLEYAIVVDGLFAGAISITFGQDIYSHCAEIGYWLGEPYWHQGIMKKAVRIIVKYIFENYDTKIIKAEIFSKNIGSKKVLLANHFSYLITLKNHAFKRGEFQDIELYELTRETYLDNQ